MHEPRPIAEQRTSGGSMAGCAIFSAALAVLLVTAGAGAALYFLNVRSAPAAAPVPPAFPPPPPIPAIPPIPAPPPAIPPLPPDPSAAPSPVDGLSEPPAAAPSGRASIQTTIRSHLREVRDCYDAELAPAPDLAGRLTVAFDIDPAGTVLDARVEDTTLPGPPGERVGACILRHLRTWTFAPPESGALTTVRYPFVFAPSS
jgi:hypothetical protein